MKTEIEGTIIRFASDYAEVKANVPIAVAQLPNFQAKILRKMYREETIESPSGPLQDMLPMLVHIPGSYESKFSHGDRVIMEFTF